MLFRSNGNEIRFSSAGVLDVFQNSAKITFQAQTSSRASISASNGPLCLGGSSGALHLCIDPVGVTGIGTTTPKAGQLSVASTTGPQLALSDGSLTSDHWTARNINGTFYLATASPSTFSTSTVAALTIGASGAVTFGNANATCIALTGSADLCDGNDATSAAADSKWATSTADSTAIHLAGGAKVGIEIGRAHV